MIENSNNGIKYLSFESLNNLTIVKNAFSTRLGGVSTGFYSSMNLGFANGDDKEKVSRNFVLFAEACGFELDHIVRTKQTHTTNIHIVSDEDVYNDGILHDPDYTDIDGLVCNIPGVVLCTSYADCVPLYFVDPVRKVIGLSHSGWRGTVSRMGEKTVKTMADTFGSDPADIFTAIGPSICQDCYEVSSDVAEEFITEFKIDNVDSSKLLSRGKEPGKYQLNLWECNKKVLLDAGITKDHIECADLCTCCHSDYLFSHRASGGKRGNLCAFLMLNKN